MNKLLSGKVATLIVTHEDRLLRFGVDLVRHLCRFVRTEMKILMPPSEKTFEEELAKDVITLMTVFCARLYGRRSHKTRCRPQLKKKSPQSNSDLSNIGAIKNCFSGSDSNASQRDCRQPAYVC